MTKARRNHARLTVLILVGLRLFDQQNSLLHPIHLQVDGTKFQVNSVNRATRPVIVDTTRAPFFVMNPAQTTMLVGHRSHIVLGQTPYNVNN